MQESDFKKIIHALPIGFAHYEIVFDKTNEPVDYRFIEINPAYTTQTCNRCGFRMGTNGTQKLTLKDRTWTCPCCDTFHVRDQNAAQNILAKGHLELTKPLTENSPIYR